MVTVILEKGLKGERTFDPEPEARAIQRALSLCNLHACSYTRTGNTIRVHAGAWYTHK